MGVTETKEIANEMAVTGWYCCGCGKYVSYGTWTCSSCSHDKCFRGCSWAD